MVESVDPRSSRPSPSSRVHLFCQCDINVPWCCGLCFATSCSLVHAAPAFNNHNVTTSSLVIRSALNFLRPNPSLCNTVSPAVELLPTAHRATMCGHCCNWIRQDGPSCTTRPLRASLLIRMSVVSPYSRIYTSTAYMIQDMENYNVLVLSSNLPVLINHVRGNNNNERQINTTGSCTRAETSPQPACPPAGHSRCPLPSSSFTVLPLCSTLQAPPGDGHPPARDARRPSRRRHNWRRSRGHYGHRGRCQHDLLIVPPRPAALHIAAAPDRRVQQPHARRYIRRRRDRHRRAVRVRLRLRLGVPPGIHGGARRGRGRGRGLDRDRGVHRRGRLCGSDLDVSLHVSELVFLAVCARAGDARQRDCPASVPHDRRIDMHLWRHLDRLYSERAHRDAGARAFLRAAAPVPAHRKRTLGVGGNAALAARGRREGAVAPAGEEDGEES
jgi:hypothetical protein